MFTVWEQAELDDHKIFTWNEMILKFKVMGMSVIICFHFWLTTSKQGSVNSEMFPLCSANSQLSQWKNDHQNLNIDLERK